MRREVGAGVVGGRQDRDAEAVEQRPRAVGVLPEALGHLVVDHVGRLLRRARRDAEDAGQFGLEPEAHRRAPEQVPAFAQQPPRRPRRGFGERALPHPEGVEPDPVGVQQPRHVMVGRHEQRRRVWERLVGEQQLRIDVAVRRDHRQVTHRVVQPPRDARSPGSAGSSRSGCQVLRRPG